MLEERQFGSLWQNDSLSRLIGLFQALPRLENTAYITLGQDGPSLEINDAATIGRDEGLSEAAINAILSSVDLPDNVIIASPTSYGRFYVDEDFEPGRAAPIPDGVQQIVCPIYIGRGVDHWVSVLVTIRSDNPHQITMQLFNSSPMPTLVDQNIIDMLIGWISHSLQGQPLQFPVSLDHVEVPHQEAINSCGVHMVSNLILLRVGSESIHSRMLANCG